MEKKEQREKGVFIFRKGDNEEYKPISLHGTLLLDEKEAKKYLCSHRSEEFEVFAVERLKYKVEVHLRPLEIKTFTPSE